MPFINLKTNVDLNGKKESIKAELGSAITAIPGKSEGWLMVEIEDNLDMYFKGTGDPCAMFDIAIFGSASDSAYDKLTSIICDISQNSLNVSADRTYVKYAEVEHWGWNNMNF